MAAIIIPYRKDSIGAEDAVGYDIEVTGLTIVNTNRFPVWITAGFILIHQVGGKGYKPWEFGQARYDEAWVIYDPLLGFVTDFSIQKHEQFYEVKIGEELLGLLSVALGNFGGRKRYNRPNPKFAIDGAVHSEIPQPGARATVIQGRGTVRAGLDTSVEIPGESTIRYAPILNIPGPGASPGMADFWDNYSNPNFDVEIHIFQTTHDGGFDAPTKRYHLGGELIRIEMIRDAFQLKLGDRALPGEGAMGAAETFYQPAPYTGGTTTQEPLVWDEISRRYF